MGNGIDNDDRSSKRCNIKKRKSQVLNNMNTCCNNGYSGVTNEMPNFSNSCEQMPISYEPMPISCGTMPISHGSMPISCGGYCPSVMGYNAPMACVKPMSQHYCNPYCMPQQNMPVNVKATMPSNMQHKCGNSNAMMCLQNQQMQNLSPMQPNSFHPYCMHQNGFSKLYYFYNKALLTSFICFRPSLLCSS